MNGYGALILAALLTAWLLELSSDLLNLGALRPGLPGEMRGAWDEEAYAKSQRYARERSALGLVQRTFDLAVLLLFWFSGGFNWLDGAVRGWAGGVVARGLLFTGLLLLARALLSLPFSLYGTFVVEERFGFNRTTARTFAADAVKTALLAVVLGGPLLASVLALFERAGPLAWAWCWAAVTAFTVFAQFVAPTWIMPLFNTFTPLGEGELRERIVGYARSVGFPLENVFVIDGSRRSSRSNAFFTGFGRHKRIALFDTLVAAHTVPELVAVLAHEIGHHRRGHILQGMALSVAHGGAVLFLLSLLLGRQGLYDAFFVDDPAVYTGLLFAALLLTPLDMALSPLLHALSRRNEYEADRFAAETTGGAGHLVDALKKLSAKNLSNLTPHPFHVFLHYSHPPLLARIDALRRGARG